MKQSTQTKDYAPEPIEGYFKIQQLDKDRNVIDTYEDHNKIMIDSKKVMRNAMKGMVTTTEPVIAQNIHINTFVLGTQGHDGNLLLPKTFQYDRSDLFSIEATNGKVYPITFDVNGTIIDEGYDQDLPNAKIEDSKVTIKDISEINNEAIEYTFEIPVENANDAGAAIAYTEAAMYTNQNQIIPGIGGTPGNPINVVDYGDLFAMRTFPAKIKDATTSFLITWRIIF
jgi:hypothetical protein